MAEHQAETKASYPYMTSVQWFGVRSRLRQSMPSVVGVDWLMSVLGTSEKGARNILPQLRAIGLIDSDGRPVEALVHDLRDDGTYADACNAIVGRVYPNELRDSWTDPNEDPAKVAAWFMRNARTGEATAKMQARLYLLLLGGELPSEEGASKSPAATKKAAPRKSTPGSKSSASAKPTKSASSIGGDQLVQDRPSPLPSSGFGPNLHIDMQIHISADASDTQIDTIFESMARHLYGRE